ncbi:MAG: hypothetical protein WCD18_16075 [Thermosynechococcaceae cyanobacterium]
MSKTQLSDGQFPTYAAYDCTMTDRRKLDSTPFGTASILYSLQFVSNSSTSSLIKNGLSFLLDERLDQSLWKYWTKDGPNIIDPKDIDPDLDDTCCCSAVLNLFQSYDCTQENRDLILANRDDDGLFKTWIRSADAPNDIDSVVNSNVIWYLGECPETDVICDYLQNIVASGQEAQSSWYYPGSMTLYYAISRAYANGVQCLATVRDTIIQRLTEQQHPSGAWHNSLETAYAIATLLNFEAIQFPGLAAAIAYLLAQQQPDGSWPNCAAWAGPEPPTPHAVWWGSEALTTGICLEGLARYAALAP